MISPINQTKNSITPSNQSRTGFFLLMEDGSYLLQENLGKLMLDLPNYSVQTVNQTKHTISPSNQIKS